MKNSVFLFLLVCSFWAHAGNFKAHFIRVGQADATLLEFSKGVVMIDVGGELGAVGSSRESLTTYLEKFYERRTDLNKTIDVLILTHNHYDHISLIGDLSKAYTIKRIITSNFELKANVKQAAKDEKIKLELLSYKQMDSLMPKGYEIKLSSLVKSGETVPQLFLYSGEISVKKKHAVNNQVFYPTAFKNPNNNSIVSKLIYGSTSLLFTGDLEEEGQKYLLAKYHDHLQLFDVDFYHVGHHGAANGTTQELLDAMTPKMAVISAGDTSHTNKGSAWDHGHPRTVTVELLNAQSSMSEKKHPQTAHAYSREESLPQPVEIRKEIYCTCWSGDITMEVSDKGKYVVAE